jgi:uracil-DNA glycosylase
MHAADKRAALLKLVRKRQADTLDGYSREYYHFRDFDCECDHVVPWTISACNVDADLMLIAQDWASEEFLKVLDQDQLQLQRELGQFPALPTNRNIKVLLQEHMSVSFGDTYATDVFPFVKPREDGRQNPFP